MSLNFPAGPSNGDIYDNYIWIESEDAWRRLTTPPNTRLNNLEDISIVTPVDGEVLIYDSASGEWVNDSLPEPVLTFSGLEDTTITSATTDQIVRWNGTVWVNDTAKTNSIANDAITTDKIANSNVTRAKLASGLAAFTAQQTITASNASWPVPALGNNTIVRVTVIGGGGGGGGASDSGAAANAGTGGTTTFDAGGAGSVSATGGPGGLSVDANVSGSAGTPGFSSGNQGVGGKGSTSNTSGTTGGGGNITVAYLNLTGISTVNVTIGAGGTAGTANLSSGGAGGRGEVIVEYVAA